MSQTDVTAPPRRVRFVKWRDPLVPADLYDDVYPPDEDAYDRVREEFSDHERPQMSPYKGPYYAGPMGIIPLNETNLPGKNFNFWVGHTNFTLTRRHVRLMDKVEGVEILRIHTRYRFWFAVGKEFPDDVVRRAVEKVLTEDPKPAPKPEEKPARAPADPVALLRKSAAARFKHWAVLRLDNKHLSCVGEDTEDKARARVAGQKGAEVLACSWETKEGPNGGS